MFPWYVDVGLVVFLVSAFGALWAMGGHNWSVRRRQTANDGSIATEGPNRKQLTLGGVIDQPPALNGFQATAGQHRTASLDAQIARLANGIRIDRLVRALYRDRQPKPRPRSAFAPAGNGRQSLLARVRIVMPPMGFDESVKRLHTWLDENCGADGWEIRSVETRDDGDQLVAINFRDAVLAAAFAARCCAPSAGGDFEGLLRIRDAEPARLPARARRPRWGYRRLIIAGRPRALHPRLRHDAR